MKKLFALLVLTAEMLTPILVRAEEQLPESTRGATAVGRIAVDAGRPRLLRLAPDGPRMTVGAAELKLDVAAQRWGITMSLAL